MDTSVIAQTVHAALQAWAAAREDRALPDWHDAPAWMRESTLASVTYVLDHPAAGPGAQHKQWMQQKIEQGWTYGAVRDDESKTHPSLVPFEQLSLIEQQKDRLVCAIVEALRDPT